MTKEASRDPDASAADALGWDAIRERAYELWERNHRPAGLEIEFWLLAERELKAERNARRAGDPDTARRSGGDRKP